MIRREAEGVLNPPGGRGKADARVREVERIMYSQSPPDVEPRRKTDDLFPMVNGVNVRLLKNLFPPLLEFPS